MEGTQGSGGAEGPCVGELGKLSVRNDGDHPCEPVGFPPARRETPGCGNSLSRRQETGMQESYCGRGEGLPGLACRVWEGVEGMRQEPDE